MIAFVLVSYAPGTPAGIERATAALAAGLREHGHDTLIITATGHDGPGVVRLRSLDVSFPTDDQTLRNAINASRVTEELAGTLHQNKAEIVVYTDALWGLGRAMADHPARKVLAVHVMGHDQDLQPALATADTVIAPSATVLREAADRGYPTTEWHIVPNGLLYDEGAWADHTHRERMRLRGPVRVLARPAPEKGVADLLDHLPGSDELLLPGDAAPRYRRVEVMLALAPFEQCGNSQAAITRRCLAVRHLRLRVQTSGLTWQQVSGWLANAAVVIVPSHAETFGLVALEAMSVGTPVIAYNVGNLPHLIGTGGVIVDRHEGPYGLWQAAATIIADPVTYRRTSRAAYYRSRDFRPSTVADTCLKAVW